MAGMLETYRCMVLELAKLLSLCARQVTILVAMLAVLHMYCGLLYHMIVCAVRDEVMALCTGQHEVVPLLGKHYGGCGLFQVDEHMPIPC